VHDVGFARVTTSPAKGGGQLGLLRLRTGDRSSERLKMRTAEDQKGVVVIHKTLVVAIPEEWLEQSGGGQPVKASTVSQFSQVSQISLGGGTERGQNKTGLD
jgi:hypothetical protein